MIHAMFHVDGFRSHHTNPVGTEWKWKMDDAETIINGVMSNHYDMLKQFRGSVIQPHIFSQDLNALSLIQVCLALYLSASRRPASSSTVRCHLWASPSCSSVGLTRQISFKFIARYPEINKFLDMLHERRISSFLVTNAQFPDAIKDLTPVCQLYVSVDAASKVLDAQF